MEAIAKTVETVETAGPGMRAFLSITGKDHWKLRSGEQRALLGGVPETTFRRFKDATSPSLDNDMLERISHVLGIYKALHVIFPREDYADRWIKDKNTAFAGRTALDRMLSGFTGLVEVRRYVDRVRGW